MDAMQRFNRISAVICLLLSCAPSTYAQDNLHGETMGTAVVQIKLAGVYQHSHSGLPDPAKALAEFHRAASQGDVEAQYDLAKMYEDQHSVLFDYSKVHSWYRLAATNGHRGAQSRLGLFFEFGKGVAQSRVQARGGRRLKDQVQQSVIGRGSTSLCLAECLAEKNKKLRPLSLSVCNKW